MAVLTEKQIAEFRRDGVLTVANAVTPEQLAALRRDFDAWVEASRAHDAPYGEAIDSRRRFDIQPGHAPDKPALRRVQAPTEVSGAYYQAMADSRMADMVADLIGPDVKLHHTKINSKLPGSATQVKWRQGLFVRGSDPRRVRGEEFTVATPQFPKTSFFAQQSETERAAS